MTIPTASGLAQTGSGGGSSGPFPTFGSPWLPWNYPSDVGNAVTNAAGDAATGAVTTALTGARYIALELAASVLGLALIGLGVYRVAAPLSPNRLADTTLGGNP